MTETLSFSATQVAEAAAPTIRPPPFINVDGVPNFRDIGGYPITESTSTRRNFIYRSGLPARITAEGLKAVTQDLHISTVYDLRSNAELRKDPLLLVGEESGLVVLHAPVFAERDASPEQLAKRHANYMSDKGSEGFVAAYAEILRDGVDAYKKVLEHIRDRPQDPLLIHCTGGKDRTGVIVALLFLLAGVKDRELIAEEYSLTEKGFDANALTSIVEKLVKDLNVTAENRAGFERMLSAKKENMLASLEYIEEHYGGAVGYLKGTLGFQDDDIERIRKNIVVEEKAIF